MFPGPHQIFRTPVFDFPRSLYVLILWVLPLAGISIGAVHTLQAAPPADGLAVYQQLKSFEVNRTALVEDLVLEKDRAKIHFLTGTFFFGKPVEGKVRGGVFIGKGTFSAEVPEGPFEKEHVQRMLGADVIQSTFETAVLRFTDDTAEALTAGRSAETVDPRAARLAKDFGRRFLEETGVNISSRLAVSILNREDPGFFLAQFDGGKRDRFCFLMDYQSRIPSSPFSINGGEKGLIFAHRGSLRGLEVWTAFYSLRDYASGSVEYSDTFDLVRIPSYSMEVDVRRPKDRLALKVDLTLQSRYSGLRAVSLSLSESLTDWESERQKKAMKLVSAALSDTTPLTAVREEWEGGLTLFFPEAVELGEEVKVSLEVAGDFMFDSDLIPQCFYPRISSQWYPRHGYLERSRYDLTFIHQRKHKVVSSGELVEETDHSEDPGSRLTRWKMDFPVAFVTFGVGMFEEHHEKVKTNKLDGLPLVFYSLPGRIASVKEDFMLAEITNSVNYFSELFGAYPYPKLGAVYFPRGFGQGFATLLLLPKADRSSKHTYSFIAHETAHQWWGNIVSWRSYRDQWLSEGFAEYCGLLYTSLRANRKAQADLIDESRRSLRQPPVTSTGVGKGVLGEVGPLILGHRLSTRETRGAYNALIYNKGALVLRMLHFLFTDPSDGSGQPFFDMMADFVKRYSGKTASTDDFRLVASEHFSKTPIARKYGLQDLNWFFRQWVYGYQLPEYRLEYRVVKNPDGKFLVEGQVLQSGVPEDWFMPLPLLISFGGNQSASGTVAAYGPSRPFTIPLPLAPKKVELDTSKWVLSKSSETKKLR